MEKILEELEKLEKTLEARFFSKEDIQAILQNYTTKEEVEKLRSELANLVVLQQNKNTKDAKKDMHEYLKKALTASWVGPYMIPTEISETIFSLANVYGIARKVSTILQTTAQKVHIPTEVGVTVYWTDEATTITESGIPSGGVVVDLKKLAGYAELSKELLKFSTPNIIDHLLFVFTKALAKEEDKAFLVGTSPFTGLAGRTPETSIILGAGKTHFSDITLDDVIRLMTTTVDLSVLEGTDAVVIMRPEVWNVITTAKDTTGNYQIGKFVDFGTRTILGRKTYITNLLPSENPGAVAVVYGDFKQANVFAIAEEVILETSMDYGFARDVVSVKLTEIISPVNILNNALWSYIKLASS